MPALDIAQNLWVPGSPKMQPATLAQAESIEDGYVRLVGHNKNLFIWGGDNNEPEEIVQPLDDVHGVLEVGFGASGAISLSRYWQFQATRDLVSFMKFP